MIYANDKKGKDRIDKETAQRYFKEGIPFYGIVEPNLKEI